MIRRLYASVQKPTTILAQCSFGRYICSESGSVRRGQCKTFLPALVTKVNLQTIVLQTSDFCHLSLSGAACSFGIRFSVEFYPLDRFLIKFRVSEIENRKCGIFHTS